MVAEPREYVIEGAAVRAWARQAVPLAGDRVFFGYNTTSVGPQIVVTRIGGVPWPLYQFDCWASSMRDAEALAAELETAIEFFQPWAYPADDAVIRGAVLENAGPFQPDVESDKPRFVVDARFMVMAGGVGS